MSIDATPVSVLFVCTANVSRSPYAEHRARSAVRDAPVEVGSAGIPGYPGLGIDPAMAELLSERGVETSGHISRQVSDELIRGADLVLTFEYRQHLRLLEEWPRHMRKIFGMRQFARAVAQLPDPGRGVEVILRAHGVAQADSPALDVGDPYRRGEQAARACADDIDRVLDVVLPVLAGRPVPTLSPAYAPATQPAWDPPAPGPARHGLLADIVERLTGRRTRGAGAKDIPSRRPVQ